MVMTVNERDGSCLVRDIVLLCVHGRPVIAGSREDIPTKGEWKETNKWKTGLEESRAPFCLQQTMAVSQPCLS